MKIIVAKNVASRHLLAEDHEDFLSCLGKPVQIKRSSHVEFIDGNWLADMHPSDGPILGPFVTRKQALAAETKWLEDNHLPVNKNTNNILNREL